MAAKILYGHFILWKRLYWPDYIPSILTKTHAVCVGCVTKESWEINFHMTVLLPYAYECF